MDAQMWSVTGEPHTLPAIDAESVKEYFWNTAFSSSTEAPHASMALRLTTTRVVGL
jgi:hypothetical protein